MDLFLVRYGEIGLKSEAVRRRFEHCLRTNIEKAFIRERSECKVSSDRGHLYVNAADAKVAEQVLVHTFGVTSYSKVELISSDMGSICSFVEKWSKERLKKNQTFAIRSRRVGRQGYSSQDIAVKAGETVRLANKEKGVKVDLSHPDVEIFIEVRDNKTYIYADRTEGPGGMPLGSQGKVIAVIDDEQSALACWLIMKRGCNPIIIPLGKEPSTEVLCNWTPSGQLTIGPTIDRLDENVIADIIQFGQKKRALALVLGGSKDLFKKKDFPIFYPVIGLGKTHLSDLMKRLRS